MSIHELVCHKTLSLKEGEKLLFVCCPKQGLALKRRIQEKAKEKGIKEEFIFRVTKEGLLIKRKVFGMGGLEKWLCPEKENLERDELFLTKRLFREYGENVAEIFFNMRDLFEKRLYVSGVTAAEDLEVITRIPADEWVELAMNGEKEREKK